MKYTLHPRPAEMKNIDKMINCGDPSFGGAMYGCTHCGNLKFVPFRCHSRFCPTCGNKYSWNVLPLCLLNSFMSDTATVFLPSMNPSVISFCRIVLSLIVSFILSPVSSFVCFLKWINIKTLPLVLSWSYILSAEISNGILISIVSSLKAVTVMMLSGVMSLISTILSFAMLSVVLTGGVLRSFLLLERSQRQTFL